MLRELNHLSKRAKFIVILVVLLLITVCAYAQTPEWEWAVQAGGTGKDRGLNICIDDSNNYYTTGFFEGPATFGSCSLIGIGHWDIYVTKADANCDWQFVSSAGSENGCDISRAITVDGNGNLYVTGQFKRTAYFGSYSITSNGMEDIFVAKLDKNGIWKWAVGAGGNGFDTGTGVVIDNSGDLYITGGCSETASFGPYSYTSEGGTDIYVAKLDNDGNWLWVTGMGSSEFEYAYSIVQDGVGGQYITGYFNEIVTFGSHSLTSSGVGDIFVAKIDQDGVWQWATQAGGTGNDVSNSINIDTSGNSYITGYFWDTAYFGTTTLISSGSTETYVAKLDTNGGWEWASQAGGVSCDNGNAICIDANGNSYITGKYMETFYFGTDSLTCVGDYDVFVAKLDTGGNWEWAVKAGGIDSDMGFGIALDNEANCYVTGYFEDCSSFGSYLFTSSGDEDIFIAKLAPPVSTDPEINPEAGSLSNFPNPFNQRTTINYALKRETAVYLEVYNLKGQLVEKLFEGISQAGDHTVEWDCQRMPSGVYFLKMKTGNEESIRKMVLLR
ncbi:MAG: SBBP repeat-containing protein [Candidatus Celaenobacter antarcticus]|nr:SBBP repeat-containing protein [Candidatus Celaenobacter antarcticus]MDP8314449.1 SBBP repeat-containing protein [Candidatus Celaenobacter antarcticus]